MDMSIEVSMPHYELKCNYTTEKYTYLITCVLVSTNVNNTNKFVESRLVLSDVTLHETLMWP
jgi:hypothetical protein